MNYYIKLILMAASAVGLIFTSSSCNKDFLDKNPLSAISGSTFWNTQADVDMALVGVYRSLQNNPFYGFRKPFLDGYSDNAYDRHNYGSFQNMQIGIVNATSVSTGLYNQPYSGIASCNYFLENVGRVTSIPQADRERYEADARFLRALYYFDLVREFGGVVLYKTGPKTAEEAKIKQSTREEVLAFVNEDLDYAISKLPATAYSGRAVKASAQLLKARVKMFEQKWTEAATLSNEIISSNTFSVFQGGYDKLFITPTQINNPEIIFSTKYLAPNNPQQGEGMLVEIGWYGSIGPYKNLVDEYEMKNGLLITEAGSGYDPNNPYKDRDPRLLMTILTPANPFINPNGTTFQISDPLVTGFSMRKYMDVSKLPFDRSKIVITDMHVVHMRYAEVLLTFAESKNEADGPGPSVYAALNAIRTRTSVNLPPVDEVKYSSKEAVRQFIRHERRIEQALEGHRYFDLKRWGIAAEKFSALKNPANIPLLFGEKNNVLPFPQSELDRNKNLVQNPGY